MWLRIALITAMAGALVVCRPSPQAPVDKAAVETTLRAFISAFQNYDFGGVSALFERGGRWIDSSKPLPAYQVPDFFRSAQSAGVEIRYELADVSIDGHGEIAWATWTTLGTFSATSERGKAFLRANLVTTDTAQSEWRLTFVESAVLRRSSEGWRIVLGHTTQLPAQ